MLRKVFLALPAAALTAGLYYADTLIFAAPIVAVSLWLGSWPAFLIFAPIYFLFDYGLGRLALGLVNGSIKPSKLRSKGFFGRIAAVVATWVQKWFKNLENSPLGTQVRKGLSGSKKGRLARYLSFIVVSYFGTAFVTIPMVYLLGQRKYLRLLTAVSASVYAITFVGQYAGATFITVKLIKYLAGLF